MTNLEEQSLEYLNQNMHRNYPIQDTCIVVSEDGTYLPSSFLVDMKLNIPVDIGDTTTIDTTKFFVSAVNHYSASVQVVISYQYDDNHSFECACSSAIVTGTGSTPYPTVVSLTPASGIPDDAAYNALRGLSGELYIGSTEELVNMGSLKFTMLTAPINPTCITKTALITNIVTNITVLGSDGQAVATVTGNVTLQAGDGIKFTWDATHGLLTVAVDEEWLADEVRAIMEDSESAVSNNPIRKINGIRPDNNGNFVISGLDCTNVNGSGAHGISIDNPCSRPCCSEESGDLVDIKDSQSQLAENVNRISQSLDSFILSLNNVETRLPSLVASRK